MILTPVSIGFGGRGDIRVSRALACAAGLALALIVAVHASRARADEPLPVVTISSPKVCVQVRAGADRAPDFACLNAALRALSASANERQAAVAGIAASALNSLAPTQVGLANVTAAKERLGANFGKSPFPQRPSRTTVIPLLH